MSNRTRNTKQPTQPQSTIGKDREYDLLCAKRELNEALTAICNKYKFNSVFSIGSVSLEFVEPQQQ